MATPRKTANSEDSQGAITDKVIEKNAQDLGWLGSKLGSRENAPIYIAGAIAIMGLFALTICAMNPYMPETTRGDFIKTTGSIVLACLTFLGGAYGSRRKD